MAEYRIGQAAELLGVSPDTVRRWADGGRVKATGKAGGRRYVDGADLARLATELAGEQRQDQPRAQSARNRFLGIITWSPRTAWPPRSRSSRDLTGSCP